MTNKDVQEAANMIIRYCREYSKVKSACVDCAVKDFCNGVAARKAPSELLTYVDDDLMKVRKIEALSNLAAALRQGKIDVAFTLLTANEVLIMKAPGVKRIVTVSDDINTMLLEVLQAVNDWK